MIFESIHCIVCFKEKSDTFVWAPIESRLENGSNILTKSEDQSKYVRNESKIYFDPDFNPSIGLGLSNVALFIDQRFANSTPTEYKRIFEMKGIGGGYLWVTIPGEETDTREAIALCEKYGEYVMFFKEHKAITYCQYNVLGNSKVSHLYRNSIQY